MRRLAAWLGVMGGAAWLSLAWVPAECTPVTGDSEVFCNRLWTLPLLAMFAASLAWLLAVSAKLGRVGGLGLAIVVLGFGLMALGNGVEYWLANQLPHEGPDGWIRGVLWMTTLAGWLAVLVGSTVLGAAALRGRFAPRWAGLILGLVIPISVLLGLVGYPAATLGIVGGVVGVLGIATAAGESSSRQAETAALS